MAHPATLLILVALILAIMASLGLLWIRRRRQLDVEILKYTQAPPQTPYSILSASTLPAFSRRKAELAKQSSQWQQAMLHCGQAFKKNRVTHIYFTHGTFVGEDSFGMSHLIEKVYPQLSEDALQKIRHATKRGYEHLTRDSGNYIPEYVEIFQEAIGDQINCQRFTWSSGNHHAARLTASIELFERLYQDLATVRADQILLFGHSHGGQVFALLSHLIHQTSLGLKLTQIWKKFDGELEHYSTKAAKLRKYSYKLATFGTPHRYPWHLTDKFNVMSVINHRGSGYLAEHFLGFWRTRGGDYVQQWGISGSDTLSPSKQERRLNRDLDEVLGVGIDIKSWLQYLAARMRVCPYGTTYLVDYRDQSRMPNFMKTVFGHACYTRYEFMLFNTQLICEHFFQLKSDRG